jgi:Ca2+-binding EF-hand superfamily protein
MMIGYFDYAVPTKVEEKKSDEKKPDEKKDPPMETPAEGRERGMALLKQLDKNGDGKLQRDEVPEALQRAFDRMDTNRDGVVTMEELIAGLSRFRPRN